MGDRTKSGQRQHDQAVLNWVQQMKTAGFKVKADLPNIPKPVKIGGDIPDAVATKGKIIKVLEVETPDSMVSDKEQRAKFRNWASQSDLRTFFTKIVRKNK